MSNGWLVPGGPELCGGPDQVVPWSSYDCPIPPQTPVLALQHQLTLAMEVAFLGPRQGRRERAQPRLSKSGNLPERETIMRRFAACAALLFGFLSISGPAAADSGRARPTAPASPPGYAQSGADRSEESSTPTTGPLNRYNKWAQD